MPLLGHTIKAKAFHSLVQVYVKVQYNDGEGFCTRRFQPRKLDYGLNLLPETGGPKTSATQMIKNQSIRRQVFELTANMCC